MANVMGYELDDGEYRKSRRGACRPRKRGEKPPPKAKVLFTGGVPQCSGCSGPLVGSFTKHGSRVQCACGAIYPVTA